MRFINMLTLSAAVFCLLSAPRPVAAGVNENSYEILENGAGRFRVELVDGDPDRPIILGGVHNVYIDDIIIGYRPVAGGQRSGGADWDYRVYGPGDAHYGSIHLGVSGGDRDALYRWWLESAANGCDIRRDISIVVLKRDGGEARRYNFFECYPVSWKTADDPKGGDVPTETLSLNFDKIQFQSAGSSYGGLGGGLGGGGWAEGVYMEHPASDPFFPPWESWMGGELNMRQRGSVGSDQFHTTTPGHKFMSEIVLKGPLTSGRKALCEWINNTVQGEPWKRTVTVKEITKDGGAGKTYEYFDCFPTRYVFPAFSSSGSGNLYEEVCIKPIRMEIAG